MSSEVLRSNIKFCGQQVTVACDVQCDKAFGLDYRPTSPNSLDENDFEWMADSEVGIAPAVSPVTEGDMNKPSSLAEAHNKWCVRQCERSRLFEPGEVIILPDFSQRISNIIV